MRRSILVALLVGAAFVPSTAAQSCVAASDWATDPVGDAAVSIGGEAASGSLDILAIRIGESGDSCGTLDIAVVADQSALEQLGGDAAEEAGLLGTGSLAARVIVDLEEDALASEDHRLEFVYLVDVELVNLLLGGEGEIQHAWVEHYVDDDLVASTEMGAVTNLTSSWSAGTITASIPKAAFAVNGWSGVDAHTQEDSELTGVLAALSISGGGDTASDGTAYTKGLGLSSQLADIDGDGLNDPWERDHFGNLSALAGDDPDGDGYSNAAEMAAGTDPNDASSKPATAPPPAPTPTATPNQPPAGGGDGQDGSGDGGTPSQEDDEVGKKTPAPAVLVTVLGLLGMTVLSRRRSL